MAARVLRILDRPLAFTVFTLTTAALITALVLLWVRASPESALIGLSGRHDGHGGERLAACLDCHVPFIGIPGSRCLGPGCHGELATGAPPRTGPAMPVRFHVALREELCSSCHVEHTTHTATSARAFTHALIPQQVRERCARCHSGAGVKGHASTDAVSCDLCHGTKTWRGVRVQHARVAQHPCDLCHAAPETVSHVSVAGTCQSCHSTESWEPKPQE